MNINRILFTLSLVLILQHTVKGQGFEISPSRVFFGGNPGETVSQTITFTNTSAGPLAFNTRVQDWDRDSTGTKIYYESGSRPQSNAKWLTLSANTIVIPAGESKQVIVSAAIPDTAKKLSNSMLFFTQVREKKAEKKQVAAVGINVIMEVGVQIYYTPKGLNPGELEFMAFSDLGKATTDKGDSRRMAIKIHNRGALNKDAFIRFELTNKETGEEIKIKPETVAMLPEATQWVKVDLPADLHGRFLAVAILDAGASYDLKVAEKEITYSP